MINYAPGSGPLEDELVIAPRLKNSANVLLEACNDVENAASLVDLMVQAARKYQDCADLGAGWYSVIARDLMYASSALMTLSEEIRQTYDIIGQPEIREIEF